MLSDEEMSLIYIAKKSLEENMQSFSLNNVINFLEQVSCDDVIVPFIESTVEKLRAMTDEGYTDLD